jgi:hypothetical protein
MAMPRQHLEIAELFEYRSFNIGFIAAIGESELI